MIVAAGVLDEKHFSSFHRFFSQAAWSRDELGLAVFGLLRSRLGELVCLGMLLRTHFGLPEESLNGGCSSSSDCDIGFDTSTVGQRRVKAQDQ